jgi:hypothetical protein
MSGIEQKIGSGSNIKKNIWKNNMAEKTIIIREFEGQYVISLRSGRNTEYPYYDIMKVRSELIDGHYVFVREVLDADERRSLFSKAIGVVDVGDESELQRRMYLAAKTLAKNRQKSMGGDVQIEDLVERERADLEEGYSHGAHCANRVPPRREK